MSWAANEGRGRVAAVNQRHAWVEAPRDVKRQTRVRLQHDLYEPSKIFWPTLHIDRQGEVCGGHLWHIFSGSCTVAV